MMVYETNSKGEVTMIMHESITKDGRIYLIPQMIDITDTKTPQEVYELIMKYEDDLLESL